MELFNFLNAAQIGVYGETFSISLNWIGNLIKTLILAVGSVGLGIILFSVILKLIVMPFDVYQRISMRKQNQKMKDNQERMEKLQKQYANDKKAYNDKVMELYKETGFSLFSSCLPLILSMVIFIVAINAFNAYAQFANVQNYNAMLGAYNEKILSYAPDLDSENSTISIHSDGTTITVVDSAEDKYIYYALPHAEGYADNDNAYIKTYSEKSYFIDNAKALQNADIKAYVDAKTAQGAAENDALSLYFQEAAQTAVVAAYESDVADDMKFLWIKNIWATDASYKHPVLGYSDFKAEIEREDFNVNGEKVSLSQLKTNAYTMDTYNVITGKLSAQKTQANGYYILIVLSIGTILLQQFVAMRSQKEQQKYSSVDGQGASQQKVTMFIMTIVFAVFSFLYSAAFSMYMIMSNVLSLLSTLIINKAVDASEKRKQDRAFRGEDNRRYTGRAAAARGIKNEKREKTRKK